MEKRSKLNLYENNKITLRLPENLNKDLVKIYDASLFDFAYLLAISLTDEFLPKDQKKSYFGYRNELKKEKSLLDGLIKLLPQKPRYKRLRDLVNEYLGEINIGLDVTRESSGRPISEKSKLILLWTQILRIELISEEEESTLSSPFRYIEELNGLRKPVNWNDYLILLEWFYRKLEKCSYSSIIKPAMKGEEELRINGDKEKKRSKSLWQKHYDIKDKSKHSFDAECEILRFINFQSNLIKKNNYFSLKTNDSKSSQKDLYPIIRIIFDKNFIGIIELREEVILKKEYSFKENKIQKHEEIIESISDYRYPSVVFPDGSEFPVKDYEAPFKYFKINSKLLDEFMKEIVRNNYS